MGGRRARLHERGPEQAVVAMRREWRTAPMEWRRDNPGSEFHDGAAEVMLPVLADIVVIGAGGEALLDGQPIGYGMTARRHMRPPPRL